MLLVSSTFLRFKMKSHLKFLTFILFYTFYAENDLVKMAQKLKSTKVKIALLGSNGVGKTGKL